VNAYPNDTCTKDDRATTKVKFAIVDLLEIHLIKEVKYKLSSNLSSFVDLIIY